MLDTNCYSVSFLSPLPCKVTARRETFTYTSDEGSSGRWEEDCHCRGEEILEAQSEFTVNLGVDRERWLKVIGLD